jgi:hypothetical protein
VASSPVAGRDFPDLPQRSRISALCGDGADMIVAAGEEKVFRVMRSHQVTQSRGPKSPLGCQVRGSGPSAIIVVTGTAGEYARFNGTDWEYGLAPALDSEDIPGAVIATATRTVLAGRQRSLYIRDGDTWTLQRYPSGGIDVVYAGADASGTIYLVGAHGRLLANAGGTFRDLSVTGISADVLSSTWVGGWYSARTNSLWIFAQRWMVKVDIASLRATEQKVPLFFETSGAIGFSTQKGDLFAVATFSDGALYDGKDFFKLGARDNHRGASMYVDPVRATLFAAGWDGLARAPVRHTFLGNGTSEVLKDR